MRCQSCGQDNRDAARFCDGCGAALSPALAPLCDAPQAYTPAHLAHKILTSRAAIEGERKQVTVLFCDLVGSTAMARRVGDERMHQLLNRFFEQALAEVHAVEGTINQFLGDGFMALFGAPLAHEDHVRRALQAALGIVLRLRDSGGDGIGPENVRIGLHTGPVVVGKIGDNLRMDYTAIGDTTNVAARLQTLAQPGSACVSEAVVAAAQGWFEFAPMGRHALKGIEHPVAAFRLLKAAPRGRPGAIAAPLVGRQHEVDTLVGMLRDLKRGHGGVVLLTGEAGSGKSRLMTELRRHGSAGAVAWFEGRALSFGRTLSYWPFIEILKRVLAVGDDDGEDEVLAQLETTLRTLFDERAAELLPYLATMLALRLPAEHAERVRYLDGPALKRQVLLSLRQLFERLAQRQPLLLLLEDWHWADQSSIELAEHLLPLTQGGALLMLFATRPLPAAAAERVRSHAAAAGLPPALELRLAPLSAAESAQMLAHLVGGAELPQALREQILRRTEGNPFFVEEVIRALVAEGVLERRGAQWQLTRRVEQVQLPESLQALILARIDRLDDEHKHALKIASVIGRSFFDAVLAAVSDAGDRLPRQLNELEQAELIRDKQRLPEPEHIFKHALIQEAAYGSVLAEPRRAIHRRVAAAIEDLFADRLDEFAPLLAHHYTAAEDWDKAQQHLFRAGDQAGRMAADAEALEHLQRAEQAYLKVYGDRLQPLQRAQLARKVGAALFGTGQYEAGHERMRQALAHLGVRYPGTRSGVRWAVLRHLGAHLARSGLRKLGWRLRPTIAPEAAAEISSIAHFMAWMDYFLDKERMLLDSLIELHVGERGGQALAEARGLSSVGFGWMTLGARGIARRYHQAAVAVAQRSAHPSAIAFAWFAFGFLDFWDGQWDEAEARLDRAVSAYREAGDIHRWGGAALIRAWVMAMRGDLGEAAALAREIIRAGIDAADPQVHSWGLQCLGTTSTPLGPLAQTEAGLKEGQALARRIGSWDNLMHIEAMLARCQLLQGRFDEALATLRAVEQTMREKTLRLPFDQVEVLLVGAEVRLAAVERVDGAVRAAALKEARVAVQRALGCARRLPLWLPRALRLAGTLHWHAGDAATARRFWRESLQAAEQSAFAIERGLTLLEKGRRLGNHEQVEQAAALFRQAGAHTYLALAQKSLPAPDSGALAHTLPLRASA